MTRYLRLFALQFRISAASAMAYRANFLIEGAMSVMWMALTLLPLIVVFDRAQGEIARWDRASALIVMAYFMGIHAVLEGIITPSLVDLVEKIRSGSFDYVLLKPVDAVRCGRRGRGRRRGRRRWRGRRRESRPAGQRGHHVRDPDPRDPHHRDRWHRRHRRHRRDHDAGMGMGIHARPHAQLEVVVVAVERLEALLGTLHAARTLATLGGALVLLIASRLVWRTAIRSYTSASS
ncbi:MAG: hypothetical protein E6J91_50025 [Deltaproteobacteria bacterium]|nr:MAG: hypothetical protein E6J91_50025 [Deltaproteobacteria bacterium]